MKMEKHMHQVLQLNLVIDTFKYHSACFVKHCTAQHLHCYSLLHGFCNRLML